MYSYDHEFLKLIKKQVELIIWLVLESELHWLFIPRIQQAIEYCESKHYSLKSFNRQQSSNSVKEFMGYSRELFNDRDLLEASSGLNILVHPLISQVAHQPGFKTISRLCLQIFQPWWRFPSSDKVIAQVLFCV